MEESYRSSFELQLCLYTPVLENKAQMNENLTTLFISTPFARVILLLMLDQGHIVSVNHSAMCFMILFVVRSDKSCLSTKCAVR